MHKRLLVSVALISLLLAACGLSPQDDFARRLGQAIKAPGSGPTTPLSLSNQRRVALAAATTEITSITADQLFDWAEANYPQFFPTSEKTLDWGLYKFRYYKDTDVYLAVENGINVVALGKPTKNRVSVLGKLADFQETVSSWITATLRFKEIPGALLSTEKLFRAVSVEAEATGLKGIARTAAISAFRSVDLDQNGVKEIIIVFSTFQNQFGTLVKEPVYSKVIILELDQNLGWIDRTGKFIDDSPILNANPGGTLVEDINNDGIPDIVFATIQEDGRNDQLGSLMEAQPHALVSQIKGGHKWIRFGLPAWNLGVPKLLELSDGQRVVVLNQGRWGRKAYAYSAGTMFEVAADLSKLGGGIFESLRESPTEATYVVTTGDAGYNLSLFRIELDNSAIQVSRSEPLFSVVGKMLFTTWQRSQLSVEVYSDGQNFYPGPGSGYIISDSCKLKLFPSGSEMVFAVADTLRLRDNPFQVTASNEPTAGENWKIPVLYQATNGLLIKRDLRIAGWQHQFSSWSVRCVDLNRDGFTDIWVEKLEPQAKSDFKPSIFINDRAGGFYAPKARAFPELSEIIAPGYQFTSLVDDFDGDGLIDYVTLPTSINNFCNSCDRTGTMRFFKGTGVL